MIIALVPFIVMLVGALVYALAVNAKASEMGRLSFFVGLFFVVSAMATRTLHL